MISVAVVLLPNKLKETIINIRLTKERKSKYISLAYKVDTQQFKSGAVQNWVNGRHPDAVFINAVIEKKRKLAVEAVTMAELEDREVTLDQIAAIVKSNKGVTGGSFFQAITDRALFHYANNAPGSYYKYNIVRQHLEKAWKRDYSPNQITVAQVEQFRLYRKKLNIHDNTIKKELQFLGTAFKSVCKAQNPFELVKINPIPTKVEKMNQDEINRMEKVKLTGTADMARDMFLFSFYTQGMRFENVCMMPKNCIKEGFINYQMNKGQKHREIKAHIRLIAIVNKYKNSPGPFLFPILKSTPGDVWQKRNLIGSCNAEINQYLKLAANAAGITKNLTFHQARHSFAYLALKSGVSYAELKDMLGHTSFATTQKYLDNLSDDVLNTAGSKLYGD